MLNAVNSLRKLSLVISIVIGPGVILSFLAKSFSHSSWNETLSSRNQPILNHEVWHNYWYFWHRDLVWSCKYYRHVLKAIPWISANGLVLGRLVRKRFVTHLRLFFLQHKSFLFNLKKRILIKLAFINRLFKYLTSPIYICNINVNCFHNQKNFIQCNECFEWKLWNFDFLKPCNSVFACKYLMHFFFIPGNANSFVKILSS